MTPTDHLPAGTGNHHASGSSAASADGMNGSTPATHGDPPTLELEVQGEDGLLKCAAIQNNGQHRIDGTVWKTESVWDPVPGRHGCQECTTVVELVAGSTDHATVSWVWNCSQAAGTWSPQAHVFVPAMVYNGNRFEHVNVPYSPFWPGPECYAINQETTITPQPGLRRDGGAEMIELSSADAATPCIGYRLPSGRAFLLLTPSRNELGLFKFTLDESADGRQARMSLSTPCVFDRAPGHIGFLPGDPPHPWKAGDRATIRFRVWTFEAASQEVLHERFCEARKDFGTSEMPHVLPFSEAFRLISEKLDARNWDEEFGYYRHGMDRNSTNMVDFWQLGWVSGGITTLPMLLAGTPAMRGHALRNLDFMFTRSPEPNGLWRAHHDGSIMRSDDPRPLRPGYQVSVRRLGDALFYGLRQVHLLKTQNVPVPAAWEDALRNLADALIRVWDKRGQLGQYLDIRSCDVLIGGTTAGAFVPAGLVVASGFFAEPRYLEKAGEIARRLSDDALARGFTNGGPCDALAAPDSESCYLLFASLSSLAVRTGSPEWAHAAHRILRQFATWVTSYDFEFPPGSQCSLAGIRSCGSVWANIQNKHAAPGICNASGEALFRYWRLTRDPLAVDLLRDIAHAQPQFVSHPAHPVGNLGPGMMCERVNISAWEGAGAVGGHIDFSTIWVETAMMLTACEIPGIYLRTDTGETIVFDHVEAKWTGGGELRIFNPTGFDAVVTVLAESAADLAVPLPLDLLSAARRVSVPAGSEILVRFP